MELMNSLMEISKRDLRRNFSDFYMTFDLSDYYSKPMLNLILNGKRNPNSVHFLSFISRCINIYSENTKDYRGKAKELGKMISEYNETHEIPLSIERLQQFTGKDASAMRMAVKKGSDSKVSNDLYDTIKMELYYEKRDLNSIFNNIRAYQELNRRLMRAQISDGNQILTIYEIAEKANLPLEDLEHLEKVCHSFEEYAKVYEALVKIQKPYEI